MIVILLIFFLSSITNMGRLTRLIPTLRFRQKLKLNGYSLRLFACLILTGLGLSVGQSSWKYFTHSLRENHTRSLNLPPVLNYSIHEMMKTYEQDSITESDSKYKRILFWNEVRKKSPLNYLKTSYYDCNI